MAKRLPLPKELESLVEKRESPDRRKRGRRLAGQAAPPADNQRAKPERRKQARRKKS
ncbi:MAG: hypothetical protein AB7I37_07065 [Pirellulales bacterium]